MTHQLASIRARGRKAQAVHGAVETALERVDQVLAGHALLAIGRREVTPELALQNAVHATHLLLFAHADAVLRRFIATLTVHSRRIRAPIERALVRVATIALQE